MERDPLCVRERSEDRVRGGGLFLLGLPHDPPQPRERLIQGHGLGCQRSALYPGDLYASPHRFIEKLLFPQPQYPVDEERWLEWRTRVAVLRPDRQVSKRLTQCPVAQPLQPAGSLRL